MLKQNIIKDEKRSLKLVKAGVVSENIPCSIKCFRIIENPGNQVSNGILMVWTRIDEKTLKLAPMPFHFILALAESLKRQSEMPKSELQIGWVSIYELLNCLPWTTAKVTNSNVYKLVYRVRNQLASSGLDRNLIEDNRNGCYRLKVAAEHILIERYSEV